jgi:hypothetical protein
MKATKKTNRPWAGILLLLLLAGALPLPAKAGLKIGVSSSTNTGVEGPGWFSDLPGRGGYGGFPFGLVYCRDIGACLALQAELLFVAKGDQTTVKYWDWTGHSYERVRRDVDVRYEYLELPLLLELYTSPRNRGFHLLVGVYAACLLRSRMTGSEGIRVRPGDTPLDQYAAVKKYDLGMICGFGFKARPARRWRTDLQVRFELGRVDIAAAGFFGDPFGRSSRNFSSAVSLGLIKGG